MHESKTPHITRFWKRVDRILTEKGLPITALSQKMGHSKSYLSASKQSSDFKVSILIELASALNCSADYLLGLTDNRRPAESEKQDEVEKIIILTLGLLTVQQKKDVLEYIAAQSQECRNLIGMYKEDVEEAVNTALSKRTANRLVENELESIENAMNGICRSLKRLHRLNTQ